LHLLDGLTQAIFATKCQFRIEQVKHQTHMGSRLTFPPVGPT
jgi:hypothetical protein